MSGSKLKRTTPALVWLTLSVSAAIMVGALENSSAPKRVLLMHDYSRDVLDHVVLDQNFQNVILRFSGFQQLTFWQQYQGRILLALGIIVIEAVLISGLLIERQRKKQAADKLEESEGRFERAFKSNPQ